MLAFSFNLLGNDKVKYVVTFNVSVRSSVSDQILAAIHIFYHVR